MTHPDVHIASSVPSVPSADQHELNPHGLSASLYNSDLAPTTKAGRTWSSYSIFTLWANDVHSLGNYAFAIGLFALGLGGWQILVALGFGALLLFGLLNFSGFMGEKTGVPFPVMSRIAFGIRGAQIPALLRGAVGLSTLGWLCFVGLWALQLVIVSYGMEMIRKYEAFAGPVILVTMGALAVWMFAQAGGSIAWSTGDTKTGVDMWIGILGGGALWVSIYATFVLNFCDFTRSAKSKGSIVRGNFWGIPLNMLLFGLIVVVMTGAQFKIDGTIIDSPSDVVEAIPNTFLLLAASMALLILTIAVNLMANFVAPIYALTNLFPKHLNFRRAGIISGVIGLLILPWNLYNSPAVITYFLGGLGALLGPLFGIIMADYWILRRARINVPDLYRSDPEGTYHFTRGVNFRAIIALGISAVAALVLAFSPALGHVSAFAWFIGSGLGAVVYLVIAKRGQVHEDVGGEEIAVAPTH